MQVQSSTFTNNRADTFGGALAAGDRRTAASNYTNTPNVYIASSSFDGNLARVGWWLSCVLLVVGLVGLSRACARRFVRTATLLRGEA